MRRGRAFDVGSLPLGDVSVGRLDDALRARIALHWERRARSEYRVGRSFAQLLPRLVAQGGHEAVVALCRRAADEETRHAEVCLALADAYRGGPGAVALEGEPLPDFGCDEAFEVTLLVVGTCCINESVAIPWLTACVADARSPLTRAANRAHLREEIDHARLGWAYLASVSDDVKADLGPWLVPMLEANISRWEEPDPVLPGEGVAGHGLLSQHASLRAVHEALTDVVLPGFAHLGVDVSGARAWLAARAGRGAG